MKQPKICCFQDPIQKINHLRNLTSEGTSMGRQSLRQGHREARMFHPEDHISHIFHPEEGKNHPEEANLHPEDRQICLGALVVQEGEACETKFNKKQVRSRLGRKHKGWLKSSAKRRTLS
jgi:hypothetical protein